jgi:hypothetical protein
MKALLMVLAAAVCATATVLMTSETEPKLVAAAPVPGAGTAGAATKVPAAEYILLEALVDTQNVAEVERLARNNFLPAIRSDKRVLAVYSYVASSTDLFAQGTESDEGKRFVVVVKVEGGTVISYSTVINVLTAGGKTEAQVVTELGELDKLVRKRRASKAEFHRRLSIVRTPFQP